MNYNQQRCQPAAPCATWPPPPPTRDRDARPTGERHPATGREASLAPAGRGVGGGAAVPFSTLLHQGCKTRTMQKSRPAVARRQEAGPLHSQVHPGPPWCPQLCLHHFRLTPWRAASPPLVTRATSASRLAGLPAPGWQPAALAHAGPRNLMCTWRVKRGDGRVSYSVLLMRSIATYLGAYMSRAWIFSRRRSPKSFSKKFQFRL